MFSGLSGTKPAPLAETATGRAEQVVHDREVVDREVPDHVHVALEQAEIHPGRVVVVDVAELAGVDQLADRLRTAPV